MTPQQQIDKATDDGFFLAIGMAIAKGLPASAFQMVEFLREVADGTTLATGSEVEALAEYDRTFGD